MASGETRRGGKKHFFSIYHGLALRQSQELRKWPAREGWPPTPGRPKKLDSTPPSPLTPTTPTFPGIKNPFDARDSRFLAVEDTDFPECGVPFHSATTPDFIPGTADNPMHLRYTKIRSRRDLERK